MSRLPIDGFVMSRQYAVSGEELAQVPGIKEQVANLLHAEIRKAAARIDNDKEQMLLRFFGNLEQAEKWRHLFIIEEHQSDVTNRVDEDLHIMVYRLECSWNLRMKTPEEIFGPYAEKFMSDNKDWSPVTARD